MPDKLRINVTEAEAIGLKVLAFLCGDVSRLDRFLALTGFGPTTLRSAASDPRALAGIVGYLLENETDLMIFAEEQAIDPRLPQLAHDLLSRS
jgi:hypothetical protein